MRSLVIGTRGSRLALRQVDIISEGLRAAHPGIELRVVEIKTEGDVSHAPLSEIGGLGVFTKAIEDALLDGRIDIAVHSLKDLPPQETSGLVIAAIPARGDPRDALVTADGRPLADLKAGGRVGTGSARRAVLLRAMRSDLEFAEIRGNVDTRIRKVESGEYDAAVLAYAGLQRLGLESKAAQVFTVEEMVPAVGQACLAVQVRADDAEAIAAVSAIDDADTHAAAMCERSFLRTLGAGCRLPVGGYAVVDGDRITLEAMVGTDQGDILRASVEGDVPDGERLAAELAADMMAQAGIDYASAER